MCTVPQVLTKISTRDLVLWFETAWVHPGWHSVVLIHHKRERMRNSMNFALVRKNLILMYPASSAASF